MNWKKIQSELELMIEQIKSKEFQYTPKEPQKRNWAAYETAQKNEIDDMLSLMRLFVNRAAQETGLANTNRSPQKQGRPALNHTDLTKRLLLQQYLSLSNRKACGEITTYREQLEIQTSCSYKSIERGYEKPDVILLLVKVFRYTQEPISKLESIFTTDGTGLSTSMKQNWESDKQSKDKAKKMKGYEKVILTGGCRYLLVSGFEVTENPSSNESPYLSMCLDQTAHYYESIDSALGDAAYLSRSNCQHIGILGGEPRLMLKRGISLKQKGVKEWTDMLLKFLNDPQKWLEEYHQRSKSETINSVLKRDFPKPLMRKIKIRRLFEVLIRLCLYNLKRLCYLQYLSDIVIYRKET